MNSAKPLSIFRILALLEGLSLIVLLFIAMPFKYLLEIDVLVRVIGMAHGVLFIAYVILAVALRSMRVYNNVTFLWILLASFIPFGTFYTDKKYLKPLSY
jgi:integral membrane protein